MAVARDLVHLHPTVTARLDVITPRRRRRRAVSTVGTERGGRVLRVDPEVWRTALRLAEGDALRIEIQDAEHVVVRVRNRDRAVG